MHIQGFISIKTSPDACRLAIFYAPFKAKVDHTYRYLFVPMLVGMSASNLNHREEAYIELSFLTKVLVSLNGISR